MPSTNLTMTDNPALKIRSLRMQLGLSQRKMAKRIGVSQQTLSDWEHGRAEMHIKAIARLVAECQKMEEEVKRELRRPMAKRRLAPINGRY
jgi:transcriptional regulator with XRE-family HTH domain